jgi:outer membrane lipoprotein
MGMPALDLPGARRAGALRAWPFVLVALLLQACSTSTVVPPKLQDLVDRSITFQALFQNPSLYQGKWVVLGGDVLSAKRLEDRTRLEILQLPLNESDEPQPSRTLSQGRFLAYQREGFLDPATLPRGTRVTIVGVVTGSETSSLDEMKYRYPTVEIHHLTVWSTVARYRPGVYWYPSYYYYPYYYPYYPFYPG